MNYALVLGAAGTLILSAAFFSAFFVGRTHGESMLPTLASGTFVLCKRVGVDRVFTESDVGKVFTYFPPYGMANKTVVIKRLQSIHVVDKDTTILYFVGDNRDHSIDSRLYGPVLSKCVFGEVVLPKC